jgi:hypothetical protein
MTWTSTENRVAFGRQRYNFTATTLPYQAT